MRTVSTPTTAALAGPSTRPIVFIEISWGAASSKLCSFGTRDWNGSTWQGAGIAITGYDDYGAPTGFSIVDEGFEFRTLMLANGVRDRDVSVWQGDESALDDDDPAQIFAGVADSGSVANGKFTVALARAASDRNYTPRERIGPAIGVNFTGTPGEVVKWGKNRITLST